MAEIKNISGPALPVDPAKIADEAAGKLPNQQLPQNNIEETTINHGAIGQPVGLPLTEPTTQNAFMSPVITGRDGSQMIAAEKLRTNGGHSATDVLLGLNRQPSTLGVLLAPPGNIEMLRHLSPASRRKILRNLLTKQRGQMRLLVSVMRDDESSQQQQSNEEPVPEENESASNEILRSDSPADTAAKFYNRRAVRDLEATTRMLDLLDELLAMQDYTLSQMGTFAQG
ncbi:MAG: hypothetical protein ABJA66_08920 [Actinomycetota bacterium]